MGIYFPLRSVILGGVALLLASCSGPEVHVGVVDSSPRTGKPHVLTPIVVPALYRAYKTPGFDKLLIDAMALGELPNEGTGNEDNQLEPISAAAVTNGGSEYCVKSINENCVKLLKGPRVRESSDNDSAERPSTSASDYNRNNDANKAEHHAEGTQPVTDENGGKLDERQQD